MSISSCFLPTLPPCKSSTGTCRGTYTAFLNDLAWRADAAQRAV